MIGFDGGCPVIGRVPSDAVLQVYPYVVDADEAVAQRQLDRVRRPPAVDFSGATFTETYAAATLDVDGASLREGAGDQSVRPTGSGTTRRETPTDG